MVTLTRETIVEAVRNWSLEERVAVIEDILATLHSHSPSAIQKRPKTLHRALGLAATSAPAPTDEDVYQWLGERRQERFS